MRKWEADSKVPGLGQLVLPSGVRTWYLRFRDSQGRQRFHKIARADRMNRTVAREQALQLLADVARGTHQPIDATTVAQLQQLLEQRHYPKLRPRTLTEYRRSWRLYVLPVIGQLRVAAVTRQHVLQLLAPAPPVQANRTLQMLRSAFNLAEVWGLRPEHSNPCHRVPRHPERLRRRYLSRDELGRLLAALDPFAITPVRWRFTQLIRLLLLTGCRVSELLAAQWCWLDQEAAILRLPPEAHKTGNSGNERIVHLPPAAISILEGLRLRSNNQWIIAGEGNGHLIGYSKMWRELLAAAGITDLRIHDLRHSFASFGVSAGLSLPQIGGLLGHASPQTTARYAHLVDETAADAAAKVAELISAG